MIIIKSTKVTARYSILILFKKMPPNIIARKIIILLSVHAISAQTKCESKLLPNTESAICVCNSSHCDVLPPVEKVENSNFVKYTTNKLGLRLEKVVQPFATNCSGSSVVVTIYASTEYQPIDNWGGTFTDSAAITIKELSEAAQEKLIRSYYSEEGLEYNSARVPIGNNDFSVRFYTYDKSQEDTELNNFELTIEDTEYKIPLIQQAKGHLKNTSLQLIAAAWNAPNWIQTNNNTGVGYIKLSMYQAWANYHLKFLQAYKQQHIDFWALSTGNQPIITAIAPFVPYVIWRPKDMCTWITYNLGPTLEQSEFSNVKIVTGDEFRLITPVFVDEALSCSNASKQYVKGIAVHGYYEKLFPPILLDITHYSYPDKFIIQTEACVKESDYGIQQGSWLFAELYAISIIQHLNHWSTGWIDFNIALNMNGGPNLYDNYVNSPIFIDAEKGEFYKQPMYYILGHFSKFMPRGSVRIGYVSNKKLPIAAAKRPDGGIVVVLLNRRDSEISVTVIAEEGKCIKLDLMPKSITTILYW